MGFLVFREVDGDQRFFTTKQFVGQGQSGFGLADAAGAYQQEHAQWRFLVCQAGLGGTQARGQGAKGVILADHLRTQLLFQFQQVGVLVFEQTAQGHTGPVGDHFGDAAGVDVQGQQWLIVLGITQLLLQLQAGGHLWRFGLAGIE
ncbi:hypothetical protein PS843_05966 [Pseudomonas fluorescens]|nr:hypothetical protein PS843_05966 [Pseudomonas fluorescens]